MVEIGSFVAPLVFVYGATLVGTVAAHLFRAGTRCDGRIPTLWEATWCAFLPWLSVLFLSATAVTQPHWLPPFAGLHAQWHQWEATIHRSEALHGLLHAANWLVLLLAAWLAGRAVFTGARMRGFEKTLEETARPTADPGVYALPASRPLCFTLGVFRPRIYVTGELLAQLDPRDTQVVLAHEAAHVRRRDTLVGAVLTLFYTLLPLPGSSLLLRDRRLAVERACDREAAGQVGSANDVALTLVRVARLLARYSTDAPNAVCFAEWGEDVEGRVQALLQMPQPSGRVRLATGAFATFCLGLMIGAALWVPHVVDLFAHH